MQIKKIDKDSPPFDKPIVLAVGFFDGIHLGHQAVLSGAVESARTRKIETWALTFSCHPKEIFAPASAPRLITTFDEKVRLLEKNGLDGLFILNFDKELSLVPYKTFGEMLSNQFPQMKELWCGENWRFGNKAIGTPEDLAKIGALHGFKVSIAEKAIYKSLPVSSTRIRTAVEIGDMKSVCAMLGRPYSITEKVLCGRQVGRANGVRTANFVPHNDLLPKNGVYLLSTTIDDKEYYALGNLGWRPTFNDARPDRPILEVHILDYFGDLYNKTLEVRFLEFLRDEKKFETTSDLYRQIEKDLKIAKSLILKLQ